MSARRRRESRLADSPLVSVESWWRAVDVREEWSAHALSCEPADRPATEATITALYAMVDAPPPEFVWLDSPSAAVDVLPPSGPLQFPCPVENRIASLRSDLRIRLEARVGRHPPFETSNPLAAVESGWPAKSILDPLVHGALQRSIRESVAGLIRAAIGGVELGLRWLGQHDVDWLALYDVHQRVLDTRFSPSDVAQLQLWSTLARSCGWWWARGNQCFVTERPLVVRMDSDRLHNAAGPAVAYPDGWTVHAWKGTRVPPWVISQPTVSAITSERNVEVRRCAIENLGWPAFISEAQLSLVAQADDPGNPGYALQLYDLPYSGSRLLLAINGSVERDGTRRQYGLHVPPSFSDPVDAAAWTYGLSGAQYALLQRRT